jgi:hypothetical protein
LLNFTNLIAQYIQSPTFRASPADLKTVIPVPVGWLSQLQSPGKHTMQDWFRISLPDSRFSGKTRA